MADSPPLTLEQTETLTRELEKLLEVGIALSERNDGAKATYLENQSSVVFAKCLMSLVGFLRFVPPSKYRAKEGLEVVDLSSATVMARQFIEDSVVFFYLSEKNLSDEELRLRQDIWLLHAIIEAGEAARLVDPGVPISPLVPATLKRKASIEAHPLFLGLEKEAQGRIKKGRQPLMLSHQEIILRRGISIEAYHFPLKAFSNFVHSSAISVSFIGDTGLDWSACYHQFIQVLYYTASYSAEALFVFIEATNQTSVVPREILQLCDEYRKLLRSKNLGQIPSTL
jgi:hypothetical protein